MVKAIFFDIDGTLVSFKNHQIPKSTFDALYKLKEKGIKLFIATGRGKDGLDVLKALGICMVLSLHVPLCDPDFITSPNIVHILQYAARIVSEGVPIF